MNRLTALFPFRKNLLASDNKNVIIYQQGGILCTRQYMGALPLANRIFFFYWKDNKFILLHHFIKKTQKTPTREIDTAQAKMKDYIERHGE